MDINEFEYVSSSGRKGTGTVACFAVALDFVVDAMVNRNTVLGHSIGGRYISYTKIYNLCNENIIIDVSFDTTNVDETTELIILKYDQEVPDNEKERIHWFGTKLLFSNWKDNTSASIYATIAKDIKYIILTMYDSKEKKRCKVLSEIYKDDLK
jgi:hypothetical protein